MELYESPKKATACRNGLPNAIYNFETWGQQAADYVSERIKAPSLIICNSVGGLAGLQAAQENRELVKAVQVTTMLASAKLWPARQSN